MTVAQTVLPLGPEAGPGPPGAPLNAVALRLGGWYSAVKFAAEWVLSLGLLIVALPLLVALSLILVTTSRGPAIYTQVRLGRDGRPFRLYKLRTMTAHCEAETGPVWSIVNDPRTTPFGRWLRASHLDELPQLWNVLRGEMSLIGPRPERPELAMKIERVLPEFRQRLQVRPGLTGLAQVMQPADVDLHTVCFKLAHDLAYIRRVGPIVDLRIALATAVRMVGLGARTSRWIAAAYAPDRPIEAPEVAAPLRLTVPTLRITGTAESPPVQELSKAA